MTCPWPKVGSVDGGDGSTERGDESLEVSAERGDECVDDVSYPVVVSSSPVGR